jgi:hypothetical protein
MRILLKENKPFARYRDRFMTDTDHAIERSYEREKAIQGIFPNRKAYVDKHKLMIAQTMHQIMKNYNDEKGHYVIYSKGSGLGLVIDWRRDRIYDDGKNHAFVVTVLGYSPVPHYKKYDSDVRVFVEVQNLLLKYVRENYSDQLLKESSARYTRFETKEGFKVNIYDNEIIGINSTTVFVD